MVIRTELYQQLWDAVKLGMDIHGLQRMSPIISSLNFSAKVNMYSQSICEQVHTDAAFSLLPFLSSQAFSL